MKRGSALLIVLGMLSFMVVSAVGFSIYMRTSRVPSSYLRRNIAARYLVRAALAKAIEELEGEVNTDPNWGKAKLGETDTPRKFYGIYDDPFPGVVLNDTSARTSQNGMQNGDYWPSRVFTPFGRVQNTEATVATLTLEALAYLPPAIVDEVRMQSRLTRTASWRSLPYDAGRYAYCAVNVSDLFDINRLRANVPRNSGRDRVTLASLCPSSYGNMMDLNTGMAATLDRLLELVDRKGNINGNPVPFTSLADFNFTAAGDRNYAPFASFIGGNGSAFLNSGSIQQGNALFITDTWFPPTNTTGQVVYDLGSNAQPFTGWTANSFIQLLTIMNKTDGVDQLYQKNLGLGVACLYDYLDSDNKPISLALPTVEAVPMVVGVSSPAGLNISLGKISSTQATVQNLTGTATDANGNSVAVSGIVANRTLDLFGITSFGNAVMVPIVVTSPFKRLAATNRAKSYTVRGLMRVWMAPAGMGCRPADASRNLYPGQALWQSGVAPANGVATFLSDSQPLAAFAQDVRTTSDAIADVTLRFSNLNAQMPIYYQVQEAVDQSASKNNNPTYNNFIADPANYNASYKSFGNIKALPTALRPLTIAGDVDQNWQNAVNAAQFNTTVPYAPNGGGVTEFDPSSALATQSYTLYASLWIQVMDGNQVVDMAPACATDDSEWLGASLPSANAVVQKLGDGSPILNFESSAAPITYATIDTALATPPAFTAWKALYAVDPRYNFASEDWFSSSANAVASKSEWMQLLGLNGTSSPILGLNGCDRDIFMFVSDQEYLQSIGELQFLPQLDLMDGSASFLTGAYSPNFHGQAFSQRTGPTTGVFANGGRFWKTYTAYNNGNGTLDINPYELEYNGRRVTVLSGTGGFKLNPFSRDDRVIGAALVGTPFDYYVASTNENQVQSGGRRNNLVGSMSLSQMMDTYSFGNSSVAKLSQEELLDIAGEIKDSFEASADNGETDWLLAWNDLMWQEVATGKINDENKTFMSTGITLQEPLHGVDRKYLYSFWRDCFDNRQQLFLIFVRAEPSSVGGGSMSRASSQLGARAVALVWRDPAAPARPGVTRPQRTALNDINSFLRARGNNQFPPHRTRVLFYHQFD